MRPVVLLFALLAGARLPAAAAVPDLREVDSQWNRLRLVSDTAGRGGLLVEDSVQAHCDDRVQHRHDYRADLDRRTRVNHAIDNHDVEVRCCGDTGVGTGRTVQRAVGGQGVFRFTRMSVLHEGRWRAGGVARVAPSTRRGRRKRQ